MKKSNNSIGDVTAPKGTTFIYHLCKDIFPGWKNLFQLIVSKEKYIAKLCGYYGEPQSVLDTLNNYVFKYPVLTLYLKKDILLFEERVKHYNTPPERYPLNY